MMALLPFLVHHYGESAKKWLSASAQSRALGAEWDEEKGCVKTFDDEAVSWMMMEWPSSTLLSKMHHLLPLALTLQIFK
jgi:hypothetical protein